MKEINQSRIKGGLVIALGVLLGLIGVLIIMNGYAGKDIDNFDKKVRVQANQDSKDYRQYLMNSLKKEQKQFFQSWRVLADDLEQEKNTSEKLKDVPAK